MKLVGVVLHEGNQCLGSYDKVAKSLEDMIAILVADGFVEGRLGFYEKVDDDGEILTAAFVDLELKDH